MIAVYRFFLQLISQNTTKTMMEDERKVVLDLVNSSYFKTLIKSQAKKVLKASYESGLLRQNGNAFYMQTEHSSHLHDRVWQFYAGSIARAESNKECLAMGYGNRSAILLHLSKYEASVRDIDRALSITKNDSLKIKLLLRKAKCLHMIGSKDSQSILKEVDLLLPKITDKSLKKSLQDGLSKVKIILKKPAPTSALPKNKKAIALNKLNKKHKLNDFSSVELQFNEKYGRHLVTAKDIRPGEVIYIEKPYVQFLNMMKLHAYCMHCFVSVGDNIPCDQCCWAMYCSEKCKKEAWKEYHDIECTLYADFELEPDKQHNLLNVQLAIKILSRALKEHGSVDRLKAELSTFDDCTDYKNGFMHDGKLETCGLKSIYLLCKNVSANALKHHTKNTALFLRSLGQNTTLLGINFDSTDAESYRNNENAIFLGSLFLRLSKINQLNAYQMWNRTYDCPFYNKESECCESRCCTAGTFIAPITGLINHDCFPNVGRCYTNDHTILLYAIEPLKKGTQIFTSYLQTFRDDNLANRKKLLSEKYNFRCNCFSCEQKLETGVLPDQGFSATLDCVLQPSDLVDMELCFEFSDIEKVTAETSFETYEKTIIRLRKGLEKAFAPLRFKKLPSIGSSALAGCLQIIFDRIYGIKFDVPEECNTI